MFDLSGKKALVTGAGQGVGAGIALSLSEAGGQVYINDMHSDRAQTVAAQIPKAEPLVFDVTNYEDVAAVLNDLDVDILVNNAGIPENMTTIQFKDTQVSDWLPCIDVNLYGVLNCTRAVINQMCEKNWGRIITISSGAGTSGLRSGVSTYAAGKGGAISFMRHIALETSRQGVTANTVALGVMERSPELEKPAYSEEIAKLARAIPTGRMGKPEDVGAICVYLSSQEASWMTGQTLQLNGGSITT